MKLVKTDRLAASSCGADVKLSVEGAFRIVEDMATELMGIQLICAGELPEEEHLIKVIDSAITVHTSNVMRHAEGSHAYILVEDLEDYYLLHFTNDGKPPRKGIRENGGLANLRRMDEQIGGGMKVVALPRFELLLKLPKKKPEDEYGVFSLDC